MSENPRKSAQKVVSAMLAIVGGRYVYEVDTEGVFRMDTAGDRPIRWVAPQSGSEEANP